MTEDRTTEEAGLAQRIRAATSSTWPRFLLTLGLLVGLAALWLSVKDTKYSWILPAVVIGASVVAFGPSIAKAAFKLPSPFLRRRLGLTARDQQIRDLALRLREAIDDSAEVRESLMEAYDALRLTEEGRRIVGQRLGDEADTARPDRIWAAPGEEAPTLIGDSPNPALVHPGARFAVIAAGTERPLGVVEVRDVADGGQVVMVCVDPLEPAFWSDLPDNIRDLSKVVRLTRYDPALHQPNRHARSHS